MRRVIYGPAGIGKSTFACAEPGAIALDYERGLEHIGVDRVRGETTWDKSLALVKEACSGSGEHEAVVVDTIDRLEDQATIAVCAEGKKKSLADFGYGDGHEALTTKWRELLFALEGAAERGRSVTLVAHVQSKAVDDPTLGRYGKYIATLSRRCWTVTHRWADAVLFANYEAGLVEGRAIMTGQRVLYTQAATGFDAKHRPNIAASMPLSWVAYAAEVALCNRSAAEVVASIRAIIGKADMEIIEKAEKYIESAAGNVADLMVTEKQLRKWRKVNA